ncbi:MAG: ectonucleotide pyrophosphatase/phosphodiesterase, partial [Pirellulales bacterium]|nr:ectonucleotide pyrophosphatase/phosphodiesterase [Pirellulales bacterium]
MQFLRYAFLCAAAACSAIAADHVVLVSIDGFAAYHLYNQQLELPNIRALINDGVWAASSETVFPSVTHPSHTTMLTGVEPRIHGVLSNGLVNRETGERFHPTNKSRTDIVKAPTLFDAAKKKGLLTAAFFWPETKDDPSIDFNVPEVFDEDRKGDIRATDPKVVDELESAGVPIRLYFEWYGSERAGAGDMILAEAAAHAIKKHKPGLLAIHILVTDKTQHEYGSHHYRSLDALTKADAAVGVLRQAIDEAGIADRTAMVIAADHGFHSVYHEMNIYPAFKKSGLLDHIELRGSGWTQAVRLKESFDAKRDQPKLERVFKDLLASPYVARVVRPDELHALGQPRFEESPYAFGHYLILPDIDTFLVVDKESDSMERRKKETPSHSHGYLPSHPRMYTSLVLWGDGIRKGETIGHVRNLDIAPTITR